MKPTLTTILCGSLAFALSSVATAGDKELYAAFGMTKEQESSPLPTDSGVFLRQSADEDWRRIGPVIQSMNSIAVDPQNSDTVFLACGNGIARSLDGGDSWKLTSGWRESDVFSVAVDPRDSQNVYAASAWGVSLSRDGGDSWRPSNAGLAETFSRTIVVDHYRPKRLLLGTADGIYESLDHGDSWRAVKKSPKLLILRLARSSVDKNVWIAGTEGQGVYLSQDDGKSWNAAVDALDGENIYGVSISPHDSNLMAAGGWGTGAWFSRDGGKNWQRGSDLRSNNVTAMTFDPREKGRLWVSTFEEGTYFSDDYGKTWQDGGLYGAYVVDLGFVDSPQ